jgi:hypothetical protein
VVLFAAALNADHSGSDLEATAALIRARSALPTITPGWVKVAAARGRAATPRRVTMRGWRLMVPSEASVMRAGAELHWHVYTTHTTCQATTDRPGSAGVRNIEVLKNVKVIVF